MKRLIILIPFILLLVGCSTLKDIKDVSFSCKDEAEKLIPDNFSLVNRGTDSEEWWALRPFKWNDGVQRYSEKNYFVKGSETGQNINLYYMKNPAGDEGLSYSTQVIDNKGNILGNINFTVMLVLDKIPGTEGTYLGEFESQDFKRVDLDFVQCKWTEKD